MTEVEQHTISSATDMNGATNGKNDGDTIEEEHEIMDTYGV